MAVTKDQLKKMIMSARTRADAEAALAAGAEYMTAHPGDWEVASGLSIPRHMLELLPPEGPSQ